MNDLKTAAQRVVWEHERGCWGWPLQEAITALRAALADGDNVAPTEPVQDHPCNPHPKAPHGYLRNASHTEDRYVCECEYWDPYEAGYQAGAEAALKEGACPHGVTDGSCKECHEEAMATPMALAQAYENGWNAALAQRRLTDEVIAELWHKNGAYHHHFARAVERWVKGEK